MLNLLRSASIAMGLILAMPSAFANDHVKLVPLDTYFSTNPSPLTLSADKGESLRFTLNDWAKRAGWQPVVWHLPDTTDYTLEASASFTGSFETNITALVDAFGSDAKFKLILNPSNKVISVEPDEQL